MGMIFELVKGCLFQLFKNGFVRCRSLMIRLRVRLKRLCETVVFKAAHRSHSH